MTWKNKKSTDFFVEADSLFEKSTIVKMILFLMIWCIIYIVSISETVLSLDYLHDELHNVFI